MNIYGHTCHATSIALIEYLKEKKVITTDAEFSLRESNIEEIKEKMLQSFSVGRFLIKASDFSSYHEFVIINLESKFFLIQSDMYRQMEVGHKDGCLELSQSDIEKLFSNDLEIFKKLFLLNDKKIAKIKIDAFDWYSVDKVMLLRELGAENHHLHQQSAALSSSQTALLAEHSIFSAVNEHTTNVTPQSSKNIQLMPGCSK